MCIRDSTIAIGLGAPPVNSVPGAQTVVSGVQTAIGGISVADADTNLATTQLTVPAGSLNVSLAGGATISAGANDSTTLTLSGTQTAINAALATVKFTGTAATTLTVLSTDATNLTDTDTIAIGQAAVSYTHLDVYKRQPIGVRNALKQPSALQPRQGTANGREGHPCLGSGVRADLGMHVGQLS